MYYKKKTNKPLLLYKINYLKSFPLLLLNQFLPFYLWYQNLDNTVNNKKRNIDKIFKELFIKKLKNYHNIR